MFAIVRLGNQQFKVRAGDFVRAPFQNCSVNDKIDIPVLAFGGEKSFAFQSSELKKSKVKAVVVRQSLGRKVLVFKKKRRKGYRRTKGHRQKITELKILELCSPEGQTSRAEFKPKVPAISKAGAVSSSKAGVSAKKSVGKGTKPAGKSAVSSKQMKTSKAKPAGQPKVSATQKKTTKSAVKKK